MNNKSVIIYLLISLFSISVQADHRGNYPYDKHNNSGRGFFYDYAKVDSVQPIVETVEHRVPRQCHHRSSSNYSRRSATPMIIGTIIGGALGNELGHNKSNKRVGAVVGGILGGSIASDISNKHRRDNHSCNSYDIEYEERVVGYDVRYRYRGNTYHTTTREHPGRRIQLKLRFEPVIS